MRKSIKVAVAGPLCGTIMMTVLPAEVCAGPMSVASPSSVSLSTPVDQVRYRHPRRYRYGYDPGAAMFAGAALGLMGAGIAAATAPRYYGYGWGGGYYPGYYGGW
jgi:hypothetical protein